MEQVRALLERYAQPCAEDCNHSQCPLLRELHAIVISDTLERARITVKPTVDRERAGEFAGDLMDMRLRAAVAAEKGDGSMTAEQIERASLIAESRGIDEETAQELVYLRDRASAEEPLRLAVGSLLDIVSELTVALEQGNKPDETFTSLVVETITKHKKGLGFYG